MPLILSLTPATGSLARRRIDTWLRNRPHYVFPAHAPDTVGFFHDLTGVSFQYGWADDALDLEVRLPRPSTFAVEIADEVTAVCETFDLLVDGEPCDRDLVLDEILEANDLTVATALAEGWEPTASVPQAKLDAFLQWNLAYYRKIAELGEHYFVANTAWILVDGLPQTVAFWPDRRSILLPTVDRVVLTRGPEQRIVTWDALAERVTALRDRPDDDPAEHRAIVSGLAVGGWDEAFRRGSPEVPPLLPPAQVHATEDLDRGREAAPAMRFATFADLQDWLAEEHDADLGDGWAAVTWWISDERSQLVTIEARDALDEAWVRCWSAFAAKEGMTLERAWALVDGDEAAVLVDGDDHWALGITLPLTALTRARVYEVMLHVAVVADLIEEEEVGSDEL